MLDHISLGISEIARSRRFYDAALRPLGIVRLLDFEGRDSDYGLMPAPLGVEFTITQESTVATSTGQHVCFRAPDRNAVAEFHAAALRASGRDDGKPGLRARYHENYFAAFVLDPDGHRIEAVCHAPAVPRDLSDSNEK